MIVAPDVAGYSRGQPPSTACAAAAAAAFAADCVVAGAVAGTVVVVWAGVVLVVVVVVVVVVVFVCARGTANAGPIGERTRVPAVKIARDFWIQYCPYFIAVLLFVVGARTPRRPILLHS